VQLYFYVCNFSFVNLRVFVSRCMVQLYFYVCNFSFVNLRVFVEQN